MLCESVCLSTFSVTKLVNQPTCADIIHHIQSNIHSTTLPSTTTSIPYTYLLYIHTTRKKIITMATTQQPQQQPPKPTTTAQVHLPRVTIKYCTQCKWMLRAAYVRPSPSQYHTHTYIYVTIENTKRILTTRNSSPKNSSQPSTRISPKSL